MGLIEDNFILKQTVVFCNQMIIRGYMEYKKGNIEADNVYKAIDKFKEAAQLNFSYNNLNITDFPEYFCTFDGTELKRPVIELDSDQLDYAFR